MKANRVGFLAGVTLGFAGCGIVAPVGLAARAPTPGERGTITRALPEFLRNTPTECVWLEVRVSGNTRYALVMPLYLNATNPGSRCVRYAANGFYILKKARRWRVIYEGSDLPSCSLGVPRDLIRCQTLL